MLVSRRSSSLASNGLEAVKTVRGKPAAYDIVLIIRHQHSRDL